MMLNTKRFGDGDRIVVCLHGWNGTVETFEPLVPHLPESVQLLAVDLPGYGDSPAPPQWTLDAIGDAILNRLDDVGVGTFDLLLSCSGAFPGFFVARKAGSDRLQSFFWVEPFAYIPWYLRLFLIPVAGWSVYWLTFGTRPGRWLTNTVLADRRQPDTDMMASFQQAPVSVPHRYLSLFDDLPGARSFSDVPGRKHLIRGANTFDAVRDSIETWQIVWVGARTHTIDGAGHLPIEETPAAVAGLLQH